MSREEYSLDILDKLWDFVAMIRTNDPVEVRRLITTTWTPAQRLDALVIAAAALSPRANPDRLLAWTKNLLDQQKLCARCGSVIEGNEYKYCSLDCKNAVRRQRDRERKGHTPKPIKKAPPPITLNPHHRNLVDAAVKQGVNPVTRLKALGITNSAALDYAEQVTA